MKYNFKSLVLGQILFALSWLVMLGAFIWADHINDDLRQTVDERDIAVKVDQILIESCEERLKKCEIDEAEAAEKLTFELCEEIVDQGRLGEYIARAKAERVDWAVGQGWIWDDDLRQWKRGNHVVTEVKMIEKFWVERWQISMEGHEKAPN